MSRLIRRLLVAAGAIQTPALAVTASTRTRNPAGVHVDAFGNNVIVIEYTGKGRRTACSQYGGTLSIVQRAVDVSVPGNSGYVRTTC